MACPDELLKPDALEGLGLAIGIAIGSFVFWNWEYKRGVPSGYGISRLFPVAFGVAGMIAGFVAKIIWQHFC